VEEVREVQQTEIKPTSLIFALLALSVHRRNAVVFRHAGLQPRVTRQVELYLACYRIHRQREIEALSPLEWLGHTIRETRAEVAALSEAAQASNDLATVTATLARVSFLTEYIQFLTDRLEGVAFGGGGQLCRIMSTKPV
jgi:hypothetical protein